MGTKKVVIVGAGAFGVSTALYLQRQHKDLVNVLLLDAQPFPSVDAASAHDTSRAIRPDYADPFYALLGKEAVRAWREDPVFSCHYHECGRVAASAPGIPFTQKCRDALGMVNVEIEDFGDESERVSNLQKRFPLLGDEQKLKGWDFYYNPKAGWANPHEALMSAMKEYQRLGGKFIGDPEHGRVVANVQATTAPFQITAVRTADGETHFADQVLLAMGASSTTNSDLLPGLGTQIHPTGFAIAHWRLEDQEELNAWRAHPVVDMYHHGYFFPPSPSSNLMKLGLGIVGFTNDGDMTSTPGSLVQPRAVGIPIANSSLRGTPYQGRIPTLAEEGIRQVLRLWAPSLINKPFFDMKICWDAMTPDGGWLIDHHPEIPGLGIATGGSGHGYKFLPVVGEWICNVLDITGESETNAKNSTVDRSKTEERRAKWRWGRNSNTGVENRRVVLQGRPVLDAREYMDLDGPRKIDQGGRYKL